jgi:hypothetical protein
MISSRFICLLGLLMLGRLAIEAQQVEKPVMDWQQKDYVSIPFRLVNKLILIPVQINGSDTLQFIFDTGLENSIICELETDEVLYLKNVREVRVRGIGSNNTIDAIQSSGNSLSIGDITLEDQDYIVLSSNVLQLSRKMGTKIHGLLNMRAFSAYIIEIDYDLQLLTFYQPGYFRVNKNLEGHASLQMHLKNGTPCIDVTIFPEKGLSYPVKLMLDTGAGNALSLEAGSLPGYAIPPASRKCILGYGINGNIKGKVGRMLGVNMGPYHLQDVLVSYPDPQAVGPDRNEYGQNGSLGSEFLRRFNIILDFPGEKIHIMANSAFEDGFHYNMSGLEILVPVPDEHRYIIAGVRLRSKAESAGIRSGDEILSINGIPSNRLSLDEIYKSLLGNHGKKIRLELMREGKRFRIHFRLEKYI